MVCISKVGGTRACGLDLLQHVLGSISRGVSLVGFVYPIIET